MVDEFASDHELAVQIGIAEGELEENLRALSTARKEAAEAGLIESMRDEIDAVNAFVLSG